MTSLYKVFALSLTRRISPLMNDFILPEQKDFIKGRFILDAIITLWEVLEDSQNSDHPFVFFKIDFDKAYDRMEWDFVLQSLYDMGFGKVFIKFVHTLLGNANVRFSLNGDLTDVFVLRRSIRQGCPIAPLLYAICADSLGWLVRDNMTKGKLKGMKVKGLTMIFVYSNLHMIPMLLCRKMNKPFIFFGNASTPSVWLVDLLSITPKLALKAFLGLCLLR